MNDDEAFRVTHRGHFSMIPHWLEKASAPAYKLYGVLMRYANVDRVAWPSRQTLADDLGLSSVRTVDRYVSELESLGAVIVHRTNNQVNRYEMLDGMTVTPGAKHDTGGRNFTTTADPGAQDIARGGAISQQFGAQDIAPEQEPVNKTQEQDPLDLRIPEPKKAPTTVDQDFAEWYDAYPRHEGRADGLKAYRAARRRGVSRETLLDGAKLYTTRPDRKPLYTALPATWIRGERWEDESGRRVGSRSTAGTATVVPIYLQNNGPDLDPYGDDDELLRRYQ